MSNLPFWAYPAMTFGGLLTMGGLVYLLATSKRNDPKPVTLAGDLDALLAASFPQESGAVHAEAALSQAVALALPPKVTFAVDRAQVVAWTKAGLLGRTGEGAYVVKRPDMIGQGGMTGPGGTMTAAELADPAAIRTAE